MHGKLAAVQQRRELLQQLGPDLQRYAEIPQCLCCARTFSTCHQEGMNVQRARKQLSLPQGNRSHTSEREREDDEERMQGEMEQSRGKREHAEHAERAQNRPLQSCPADHRPLPPAHPRGLRRRCTPQNPPPPRTARCPTCSSAQQGFARLRMKANAESDCSSFSSLMLSSLMISSRSFTYGETIAWPACHKWRNGGTSVARRTTECTGESERAGEQSKGRGCEIKREEETGR